MAETFDYVVPQVREDRVRLNLGRGPDPAKWEDAGWLEATIDLESAKSGEVRFGEVTISLPGRVTPSRLQRFPWARCLRIIEAVVRNPGPLFPAIGPDQRKARQEYHQDWAETAAVISDTIGEAMHGRRPTYLKKRPGRQGHPEEHYQRVADAYKALIASGEPAPNKRIGEEWGYSRNTVAGWVREARKLGLLPPARVGRAG